MLFRFLPLLVLLFLGGCSGSDKTFIPEKPDPPPVEAEGTLKAPTGTVQKKTGK
jgi:hypothetical protein